MHEKISLGKESWAFLEKLLKKPEIYQVKISKVNKATIIDCGINVEGSLSAALLFTKISLGGLAEVQTMLEESSKNFSTMKVQVKTSFPVLATLGCQAASWNINKGDFFGMACGPGRALAQKPSKSYKLLEYKDNFEKAILCIESENMPNKEVIDYIAKKCQVEAKNLYVLMINTNSLVEYIQMAARAIELGVFRLVEQLGYPKEKILHAIGTGVVAPISKKIEESNNNVNNALIYGTKLYLIVKSEKYDNLAELVKQLPSLNSKSYGGKFLELFNEAEQDFSKFDLSLLAPSEVIVNDIRTGKIYHEGKIALNYIFE